MSRPLTVSEMRHLASLGPHSRAHAHEILTRFPRLTITSSKRGAWHNRAVGGSPTSYHLRGRAADFDGPRADLVRLAREAWKMRVGVRCTGPEEVIHEDRGRANEHVHVAW